VPELEAWEKVIITGSNGTRFLTSAHGPDFEGNNGTPHVLSCQHCHGGAPDFTFNTMAEAHDGMYADPSAPGQSGCTDCHDVADIRSSCDGCHTEAVTATSNSLHSTQRGYITAINDRCGCEFDPEGNADFEARCAGCHTTCGQCHISRPNSVGGGFPLIGSGYSHRFRAEPDMNEQCTACHGSRIGGDFRGEFGDNVPDIHRTRGMRCSGETTGCHSMEEIHGDGNVYNHRYEVESMPRCEGCHDVDVAVAVEAGSTCNECHVDGDSARFVFSAADINHAHHTDLSNSDCADCHDAHGTPEHGTPGDRPPHMQCQVCHSQPYKNCTNCHNMEPGHENYDIEPSVLQLKIARRNEAVDYRQEYDVTIVRHIPIDPGTFANWGLDLPNYSSKPTWMYSSPHNVITSTAQTQVPEGASCTASCHGTAEQPSPYLLRETDLYEEDGVTRLVDYDANIGIVIPAEFPPTE